MCVWSGRRGYGPGRGVGASTRRAAVFGAPSARNIRPFLGRRVHARPTSAPARQAATARAVGGVVNAKRPAQDSGPRARRHSAPTVRTDTLTVRTDSVFGVGAARPNRNGNPRRSRPQAAPGAPLSRTGDSFSSFCILAGALDRLA